MATVTWLGDDSETTEMEWRGVKFEKDKPVQTEDAFILEKARNNKYFKIAGGEGGGGSGTGSGPKVGRTGEKLEDQGTKAKHPESGVPTHNPSVASTSNPPGTSPLPPSQTGAQKPAEKPGEPSNVTAAGGAGPNPPNQPPPQMSPGQRANPTPPPPQPQGPTKTKP